MFDSFFGIRYPNRSRRRLFIRSWSSNVLLGTSSENCQTVRWGEIQVSPIHWMYCCRIVVGHDEL